MDNFYKICGYIGGILLALCGAPEAYLALKTGDSALSWTFLAMWGIGEVCILIPVLFKIKEKYLILNYLLNVVFIGIICLCKAL